MDMLEAGYDYGIRFSFYDDYTTSWKDQSYEFRFKVRKDENIQLVTRLHVEKHFRPQILTPTSVRGSWPIFVAFGKKSAKQK